MVFAEVRRGSSHRNHYVTVPKNPAKLACVWISLSARRERTPRFLLTTDDTRPPRLPSQIPLPGKTVG